MVTTQMNDWNRHLNGIPWTKKERPGLRSPKEGRPMQSARPLRPASCVSTAPLTPWIAVQNDVRKPNDARKQRLLREAHGSTYCEISDDISGEISSVENAFVILVTAVLALSIYWGAVAVVLGSTTVKRGGATQQDASSQKKDQRVGNAVSSAQDQYRPLINKDSGTR